MSDYSKVREQIEALLKRDWGPRCDIKDTLDFPDLNEKTDTRCPVCVAYEKFDAFWEYIDREG